MKTGNEIKLYLLLTVLLAWSCESFLDQKPDIAMVVPTTLNELQGLLDDDVLRGMNFGQALPIISSDDLSITDAGLLALSVQERNAYLWESAMLSGEVSVPDWDTPYRQIQNANLVLEGLSKVRTNSVREEQEKDLIRGRAHFYRALAHTNLLIFFSDPFQIPLTGNALGIPIRNSSNINIPSIRIPQADCLQPIFNDLGIAADLLPDRPDLISRPSKAAVYALLSRLYLYGQDYAASIESGKKVLEIYPDLLDYTTLNPALPFPFQINNVEVIFQVFGPSFRFISSTLVNVNPEVIALFEDGDLRKNLFLRTQSAGFGFRGHYTGQVFPFAGLGVDEVRLNVMEGLARLGNFGEAMEMYNEFSRSRFTPENFSPLEDSQPAILLGKILEERRRALLYRGIRWMDLKRFNQNNGEKITLSRSFQGTDYILPPGSNLYTFPIPDIEVREFGMPQNPRD
jgi:pentatricopeptide repeat protein